MLNEKGITQLMAVERLESLSTILFVWNKLEYNFPAIHQAQVWNNDETVRKRIICQICLTYHEFITPIHFAYLTLLSVNPTAVSVSYASVLHEYTNTGGPCYCIFHLQKIDIVWNGRPFSVSPRDQGSKLVQNFY